MRALSSQVTIASVVEGHGEVGALPVLLRRIANEINPALWLNVPRPYRANRSKLVKPGELEVAVQRQAELVAGAGGVLVLIDADDDCPASLGPALLARLRSARPDKDGAVVLAKYEFEAWFLAAAPSLAGCRGLSGLLTLPQRPEGIRDAKGWLSQRMPRKNPYSETSDQAALAKLFDMALAREHSPSFDKFWREVSRLLTPKT